MNFRTASKRASFFATALLGFVAGDVQASTSGEELAPARSLDEDSSDLQTVIGRALREADLSFIRQVGTRLPGVETAWQAPNRDRNLRVYAHDGGVHVTPFFNKENPWSFGLKLESISRGGESNVLPSAEVVAEGDRVEYRRAGSTEWYLNSHDGLEQVITVNERPMANSDGALRLGLGLDTEFTASVEANGLGVSFADDCGEEAVRYAGLSVFDAEGRSLEAKFVLDGDALSIEVDDADAVYPLTVDPMLTNSQTPIQPSGAPENAYMGFSVDMHGDTCVIGTPGSASLMGTAYVLKLTGLTWSVVAKLDNSIMSPGDRVGTSVAVYGDYILLGAPADDQKGSGAGRVVVYKRNASGVWGKSQELVDTFTDSFDAFGHSVSLGLRFGVLHAAIGAPGKSFNEGAVYTFRLAGEDFVKDQTIAPQSLSSGDFFGDSVDLDNARIIIGASFDDQVSTNAGKVYVYRHDGFVWNQTQTLLPTNSSQYGRSVALEDDSLVVGSATGQAYFYRDGGSFVSNGQFSGAPGSTAHVDVLDDGNWTRAILGDPSGEVARILEKTGNQWNPNPIQTLGFGTTDSNFGSAVKLEGIYAFVGASGHDVLGNNAGAAYAFRDISSGSGYGFAGIFQGTNADEDDQFGKKVAIEGEIAVIGAEDDSDCGYASGAVYVFERDGGTWSQTAKLLPSITPKGGGRFGKSVDIEGERIAVGAPQEAVSTSLTLAGGAYVFIRDNGEWTLQQRVVSSDIEIGDHFGESIGISGNLLAVGAPWEDENGDRAGAAYLFEYDGNQWNEIEKLIGSDTVEGDELGDAIAIDGETVMVGAPLADEPEGASGAVYIFRLFDGTWQNTQSLRATDHATGQKFGCSVAIDGDLAIFGADGDDEKANNAGAAYVYRFNTVVWLPEQKIMADNGNEGDVFGISVDISGNLAIVGARHADRDGVTSSGTAYIYERNGTTWTENSEYEQMSPTAFDRAGEAVAIDGITAVVGMPGYDTNEDNSGRAIIVVLETDPPTTYCTAKQTSCGNLPQMSYIGESSASQVSGFTVRVQGVPGGKFGLLFYSDQGRLGLPFDGGFLCVKPALRRSFPFPADGTPGTCNGTLAIDMNRFAAGLLGGNPMPYLREPGTVINCQFWGRDLPARSMLSNGLEYTVGH